MKIFFMISAFILIFWSLVSATDNNNNILTTNIVTYGIELTPEMIPNIQELFQTSNDIKRIETNLTINRTLSQEDEELLLNFMVKWQKWQEYITLIIQSNQSLDIKVITNITINKNDSNNINKTHIISAKFLGTKMMEDTVGPPNSTVTTPNKIVHFSRQISLLTRTPSQFTYVNMPLIIRGINNTKADPIFGGYVHLSGIGTTILTIDCGVNGWSGEPIRQFTTTISCDIMY